MLMSVVEEVSKSKKKQQIEDARDRRNGAKNERQEGTKKRTGQLYKRANKIIKKLKGTGF